MGKLLTMAGIKILPAKVINQIAAGEVVERPASVVKELIENALDAAATQIEVEIQEWGSRLIRVSDNGEGMTPQDARIAVQKHATSKIATVDDISRLNTFGFRGEALSSISSVSRFELSTRKPDALSGVQILVKGGGEFKAKEYGRSPGTTVSVANLFFNTPARMKFMKKASTEENHIVRVVSNYALAFPAVGFKLLMDGREVILATPSDFKTRQSAILGRDQAVNHVEVNLQTSDLKINGVVSRPNFTKPTRESMIFFVNHRWISNASLGHAVMTAFHTLLPVRRYPTAILFLELSPDRVDVNVHPTKREVKFANDREVFNAIVQAVRRALIDQPDVFKQPVDSKPITELNPFASEGASSISSNSGFLSETLQPYSLYDRISEKQYAQNGVNQASAHSAPFEAFSVGKTQLQATRIDKKTPLYHFSQLFNTFIVFQSDAEMFIADQHTVHERLNYDHYMKSLRDMRMAAQSLLVPVSVEFSSREAHVMRAHQDLLQELGFEVSHFGGNTFMVYGVPVDLAGKNIVSLIKDLVDELTTKDASGVGEVDRLNQVREKAIIFMSCRSAVMAGDRLNDEQMKALIDRMRQADLPFTCPHGRPTVLSIPLTDLYRLFSRH
jgi:DNA mismatch repair protein MutL